MRRVEWPNMWNRLWSELPGPDRQASIDTELIESFLAVGRSTLKLEADRAANARTSWDTVYRSVTWVVRWAWLTVNYGTLKRSVSMKFSIAEGSQILDLVYSAWRCGLPTACLYVGRIAPKTAFRGFFQDSPRDALAGPEVHVQATMWAELFESSPASRRGIRFRSWIRFTS